MPQTPNRSLLDTIVSPPFTLHSRRSLRLLYTPSTLFNFANQKYPQYSPFPVRRFSFSRRHSSTSILRRRFREVQHYTVDFRSHLHLVNLFDNLLRLQLIVLASH